MAIFVLLLLMLLLHNVVVRYLGIGVVAGEGQGGQLSRRAIAPFPTFWAVGKFASRNAKFRVKNPILRKFRGKIEIWSTRNLLCRKIVTFCPACLLF